MGTPPPFATRLPPRVWRSVQLFVNLTPGNAKGNRLSNAKPVTVSAKAPDLVGGGAVGAALRAFDWSRSALGPPGNWPDALRTMANLCLSSPFPLLLWWGNEFAVIYNDDWVKLAGAPPIETLARPAATGWPELWQALAPKLRHIMETGETIETDRLTGPWANIALSHMPIRNADGSVGGVLSAVREVVAREGLRRERELLQSIIDTIPVMITLFEPGQKVLRVNREFERVIGWKADEMSPTSLMEECYPDPAYREEVSQFMESVRGEWRDIRMRARGGRDIETSWANISISDSTEVGIGIDITDRKRAEQQRTLLINELNHRVKNTLATVQSLAAQSLKSGIRNSDARERFEARLSALAQAHDLLTTEGWRGAALRDIVDRAIAPFQGSDERVAVAGPTVQLSPKQALAMSMALHELGTNALKYGALSRSSGRVAIEWRVVSANGIELLELTWREEGGPPVRPPQRKGFGSRLIERNLARELDGTTTIDYRRDGVLCRIACRVEG